MSLNDYEVIRSIGKGSYGEVSLIQHKKECKQYVIKKMALQKASKRERKAAELEAKLLSNLKHPNIVSYKDSFESDNGFLYIVMGFAEGGDLYTKLREQREKNEFLTEVQVVRWFIQICMAIQYLHQKRILHRDLKTQNIFLTKTKMIKVGDLGIARVLESNNDMATTLIGTPYYMSPELFSNKPYNYKSDVWALGCCVYEMITLRHAFNAKDMNSLVYKILKKKMPKMPDLYSKELCELIKIMLHQSAEKRPSVNRILRNSFIKKHIQLFLDESSRSRRPRSGKKKEMSSRKSSVATNQSRTNSTSSTVSQSPATPVILSPKEKKSDHIYEVIIDPVAKLSHDNHRGNQPHYESIAMKPEPVEHTYVNVKDVKQMLLKENNVKEKLKLTPSPPPASKPTNVKSEKKDTVGLTKETKYSRQSPVYSHARTPSGDKRNELTESSESISSTTTEGRVSSARERRRQEQRRKREMEMNKGAGDCPNFVAKKSEIHSPSPPVINKEDQILKENQRVKEDQRLKQDQGSKEDLHPRINEEQRVPIIPDSPHKRKESAADEDQFYTLLHTTLKISEDSPPDTPPNTDPTDQGLSPVPELSESSGSSILVEEKIKSKPPAPSSGNTPQATPVSYNLPQHLQPNSNVTGISQMTLASTGKLMDRIVALRKDCIHGLGVPLLHRAYELLDSNEEEDVLETKLVELLGDVRFKQWAGKIWQLKFCEESIFKHCGSITAY